MHDLKSLQLDDEDSSKYFINYINESSDGIGDNNNNENESIHSPDDNDDIDISSLPNSLIITPVPQQLFTNQQLKVKICLFVLSYLNFSISKRMNLNNYFVFMIQK
jgi:hypothetical protein